MIPIAALIMRSQTRFLKMLIGVLLLFFAQGHAQLKLSSLTVRAGVIRNLSIEQSVASEPNWTFYPEVQIGGMFFAPSFTWGLSWGYWTTHLDRVIDESSPLTYSRTGHIVALRVGFNPIALEDRMPIPVTPFAGIAGHFVDNRYQGGRDSFGNAGSDSYQRSLTPMIGLAISLPILQELTLEAEGRLFVPIDASAASKSHRNRTAYTFACTFTL